MKCLYSYKWIKLRRDTLPDCKGLMGSWLKLAAKAAFRKGQAKYCGYINEVEPGTWVGGIVGLKSILGANSREQALSILNGLSELGYISYSLDSKTKILKYRILDWVIECAGESCMNGSVYATDGYGFLCIPRSITQRLLENNRVFSESDAWLDLYVHTIWQERNNAFSRLTPVIQFSPAEPVLTLEALGKRWQWEKTKVWRFLKKYNNTFSLVKLPGAYGCLVINSQYPTAFGSPNPMPEYKKIVLILEKIRISGRNTHFSGTDHERICKMIMSYSDKVAVGNLNDGIPAESYPASKCRVAVSHPYYTRAYFSYHLKQCQCLYQCSIDCRRITGKKLYLSSETGYPPGFTSEGVENHVRNNEETLRKRRKPSLHTVCGIYEIPREEGTNKRFVHSVKRGEKGKAGTPADHVPQYHASTQALSEYQVGSGVLP